MLSKFISYNRSLSNKLLLFLNKHLGAIDNSEIYFYSQFNSVDITHSKILEIGGTQRPLFKKNEMLYYAGLDIDNNFDWMKIYHAYYNHSCTEKVEEKFDFIFSKYLLEHVDDNQKTFDNIIYSLHEQGKAIQIFPLGFHPYSILTRLVSNSVKKNLIKLLRPETVSVSGYPTYFNLCNSISLKRYFSRRTDIKYSIKYFFGADDYFGFFFPLFFLSVIFNRLCKLFNLNIFASNAVLVITKKAA